MLAVEGPVVVRVPHLVGDLEGFFEALEALLERGEGHAESVVLAVEPGGADAEPGAAAGEDVEGGDLLRQDARVAIGDAGDHGAEADAGRLAGEVAEGGVGLEHVVFGGADHGDLEVVVHDPDGVEPGGFGGGGDFGELRAEPGGAAGPGEVGDLKSDFHSVFLPTAQPWRWFREAAAGRRRALL